MFTSYKASSWLHGEHVGRNSQASIKCCCFFYSCNKESTSDDKKGKQNVFELGIFIRKKQPRWYLPSWRSVLEIKNFISYYLSSSPFLSLLELTQVAFCFCLKIPYTLCHTIFYSSDQPRNLFIKINCDLCHFLQNAQTRENLEQVL